MGLRATLWLNDSINDKPKWTEKEIEERHNLLVDEVFELMQYESI